jgi:hypothetical protein
VRNALAASAVAIALLASACGNQSTRRSESSKPAPKLEGAVLQGTIPGTPADGSFVDKRGRPVKDVHVLLDIGSGRRGVVLLLGRRDRRPCVGAASASNLQNARLDCLESYEDPPLVVKLVAGGSNQNTTDWLAVLGLARSPSDRIELASQRNLEKVPLTKRSWPGFPWQAFGAITTRGALGNMLTAFDVDDQPVVSVELSWSYNAPCMSENGSGCRVTEADKPWVESRDPIDDESGVDAGDQALVFASPVVRRLVAGRAFFIGASAGWQRCDGSPLGSVVSFRVWPPVSFRGEIPFVEFAKPGDKTAYRQGRAYVEAERIASVDAWVDRAHNRVVGIELDAVDDTEGALVDQSQVRIKRFEWVEKPVPTGGPDDTSQCPETSPGE